MHVNFLSPCLWYLILSIIHLTDCCSHLTLGGVSLSKSGIVPTGRAFPVHKPGANTDYISPGDVNLHLLPSNPQASDQYMVHTTFRPDKAGELIKCQF